MSFVLAKDRGGNVKTFRIVFFVFLSVFITVSFIGCKKSSENGKSGSENPNPPAVKDAEVYTVDSVTHKIVPVTMKKGETYPLMNPETKEKTLWKAYYCNNCKIVFGEKPGTKATKCPNCGSTDITPDTVKDHLDATVWDK
jgi:hypothetical protein